MTAATEADQALSHPGSALEVLPRLLQARLTSFGETIAHLGFSAPSSSSVGAGLTRSHYADVVALSQFLPGPASSKVGIMIGVLRAGIPGALAAWIGFTMPSALALILFGYGVARSAISATPHRLHGLKIVAVASSRRRCGVWRGNLADRERATIAVAAAVLALAVPSTIGQVGAIVLARLIGWWHLRARRSP